MLPPGDDIPREEYVAGTFCFHCVFRPPPGKAKPAGLEIPPASNGAARAGAVRETGGA